MDHEAAGFSPDPQRPHAMLKPGAVTWSVGGKTVLPWFEGLGKQEREAGMTFATFPPTMFLVAHVDYVRSVRVLPIGPEQTELIVDWYVHRDLVNHPKLDVDRLTAFARRVVSEDARICELNQQGIRCGRHERGVLTDREHFVIEFEQWVRERLGEA
jgi:Rieske 2Fe-2S family protein